MRENLYHHCMCKGMDALFVITLAFILFTAHVSADDDLSVLAGALQVKIIQIDTGIDLQFCRIPQDSFVMGRAGTPYSDEYHHHKVIFSKGFWLGRFEVTQEQWYAIMGGNPSRFKGEKKPVDQVSWNDCHEYIVKLNRKTGNKFRLPYEAEWEYACRSGTESLYYWGDKIDYDYLWIVGNSEMQTHDVGLKAPNNWGLFDMSGNVWEWCQDFLDWDYYKNSPETDPQGPSMGKWRVMRGGSWFSRSPNCTSIFRCYNSPDNRLNDFGFRLAADKL